MKVPMVVKKMVLLNIYIFIYVAYVVQWLALSRHSKKVLIYNLPAGWALSVSSWNVLFY